MLCLAAIAANTAKPGQKPLVELDGYRYGKVLVDFGHDPPKREMDLDSIKMLVEWKL